MDQSISYGRESVALADLTGDDTLRADTVTTLAGSLAIAGRKDEALAALDFAAQFAPQQSLATLEFQRGTIFATRSEVERALKAFSAALSAFEAMGDEVQLAWTLHNRGLLRLLAGDLDGAGDDLNRARDLHARHGHAAWLSGAEHNLGLLAAHRGYLPEALRRFAVSEELEMEQTGLTTPIHASRCEVLLSAGLFREALTLATKVYETHVAFGRSEDEAEARLVAAQAALLGGNLTEASNLADLAAKLFHDQGKERWVASARRVGIHARYEAGAADWSLLVAARDVAEELSGGLAVPASDARLLAGLIALDLGLIEEAAGDLEKVARYHIGPIELRLHARVARARLCLARGDTRGAAAAAHAGMRQLDQFQAALGATDIRSGIEKHGAALATLGLSLALASGRARRAFSWMERTRARSLRFRPVGPPDDRAQASDLARLRLIGAELRRSDGNDIPELSSQVRQLQESIRRRTRETAGDSTQHPGSVSTEDLLAALRRAVLIELATDSGRLWAVKADGGRMRLLELGAEAEVAKESESLRFMLRRSVRGRPSGSLERVADRLDQLIFGAMDIGTRPVILVPTPGLYAAPWSILRSLRDRHLVVAPSSEMWLRATRIRAIGGGIIAAAGPGLTVADQEVVSIASLYAGAESWDSGTSKVDTITAALENARVAHLACHAFFEIDNPMFSSLRLMDGDLYVYDIERLRSPPQLVILSACDSGFTETHAGEELMGLSSALLSMGTRSIIASVGLVPDSEATKDLMVALHRGLIAGLSPSVALHQAQTEAARTPEGFIAASSFICIGAG
ncbi:MAG TPA: CHAT domain-containing protein [Acidimicrobiia bacterium]|nr:CHAT domain-containing protein [Acidimicrobiia bacterium]